jgi:alpha-tubulin suppressor-like RCC1 family protein
VFTCGLDQIGQTGMNNMKRAQLGILCYELAQVEIPNSKRIKFIACGALRSFFITEDNEVYGSGNNNYYQLGLPETIDYFRMEKLPPFELTYPRRAIDVEPLIVTHVTCSYSFTTFVCNNKHIFVCGQNWLLCSRQSRQCVYMEFNELEEDEHIESISGGSFHCMLLTNKGNVYSGGEPGFKLAQPDAIHSYDGFRKVSLFKERVKIVKCKCDQSVVVTLSNRVYVFGSVTQKGMNSFVPLDNGMFELKLPNLLVMPNIIDVALSRYGVHVVTQFEIFSAGYNEHCSLNIGSSFQEEGEIPHTLSSKGCPILPGRGERYAVACGEHQTIVYLLPFDSTSNHFFQKLKARIEKPCIYADVEIQCAS